MNTALLHKKNCIFHNQVTTWEEAIALGCSCLESEDIVSPQYKDKIIQSVETYGPYFLVLPQVAFSHTQDSDGAVFHQGISFLKLETPVSFHKEQEGVQLVFTLASTSSQEHMAQMTFLSRLLLMPDGVEHFLSANCWEDLSLLHAGELALELA